MKRFMFLLIILFTAYMTKPYWADRIDSLKEKPEINAAVNSLEKNLEELSVKVNSSIQQLKAKENTSPSKAAKPDLAVPTNQKFSVYNITLGETKEKVEKEVGAPERVSQNEYGVDWYAYHQNYQNFMMVSYDQNNKVNGLYTDQDLISSSIGIKLNSAKAMVEKKLGTPLSQIRKGFVMYQVNSNGEYDMYHLDHSYVTIFYDQHENNTVTAIQIISDQMEQQKNEYYTSPGQKLEKGFEYQLFDLTNAARVEHGLSPLKWDDRVHGTALKHSEDMAKNNYFDHTDLQGKSPFDRMHDDNITFMTAGENLAFGQISSIFAHEGLMNSLGHRKNILQPSFKNLGVGVAFGDKSQPYYTENFYSK
ncbi:CAP domain-containing protein [Falsibacillus albus]|uniref:Serine protease n=1 Tax=Falsibacillus albus TaxID=2478915 RepID=A0A3L7JZE6_9BACI|nr:CAP domain-containing protein [Falsibacillus albus]RLQ96096.1 serine protease [Falsibacillus albus]